MSESVVLEVCCAVIRRESQVLVVQRPPHKAEGLKWEFPGGKREAHETAEDCIHREILEELGIQIRLHGRLRCSHVQTESKRLRLLGFLATWIEGDFELREHVAARWILPEACGTLDLCPADRDFAAILQESALEDLAWWKT